MMVMQPRNSLGYGLFFLLGFLLSSMVTWISNTGRDSILSSDGMSNCHKLLSEVTRMISRPVITYNDLATNNRPNSDSTQRKILLDCGGNMASTVGLFRETYPGGKEFIIHSFEIDDRLAPYFSPYGKHHLHCPLGVADSDGNMTAYSESPWAPDKGMNNGIDMQWGGGTLFIDKKELADTKTGGRRKLSYRKKIPTVDLSRWIQENTRKEDYVIFKLDVEGAEFAILRKMLKDGTFAWIDKYYGEYHWSQPVGIERNDRINIVNDVKKNGRPMLDWGGESRNYEDFEELHPVKIPSTATGSAGLIYKRCSKSKYIALVVEIGMSKKQAIKVMSTLASYRIMIPVTVFVYSEFAEEWPDLVKSWATTYNIGLRGTHPYPPGNFEKMSPNWIREAVVSAELLLHELGIIPMYYLFDSVEDDKNVIEVLTKRGFRIIRPESNFPPKFKHTLTVDNYYKFRDVERVPKALRVIYEQLKAANGGILSLNTDLPDTFMNLVFLLDYLVENSGSSLTSLDNCIT